MSGARRLLLGLAMIAAASAATGQDLSGPLTSSDAAPAAVLAKPVRAAKQVTPRTKAGTRSKRTAVPVSARLPAVLDRTISTAKVASPTDPVSFGMKWNGSNESAGQTRIENLNGGATGTGAEVGMKLHF